VRFVGHKQSYQQLHLCAGDVVNPSQRLRGGLVWEADSCRVGSATMEL